MELMLGDESNDLAFSGRSTASILTILPISNESSTLESPIALRSCSEIDLRFGLENTFR